MKDRSVTVMELSYSHKSPHVDVLYSRAHSVSLQESLQFFDEHPSETAFERSKKCAGIKTEKSLK